jgi:hypothetical protein
MFEMRFAMLAERLALGITLPFFLGTTMCRGLSLAVFSVFSLEQSAFQRTMVCNIGFVLLQSLCRAGCCLLRSVCLCVFGPFCLC